MTRKSPDGRRIRVALVGCSGLLGEIVSRTVRADDGLEVVAEVSADAIDDVVADLVVWNDARERDVERWLRGITGPRIVATLNDGRAAALWELAPRRTGLGELSPETLLAAIHDTAPPHITGTAPD